MSKFTSQAFQPVDEEERELMTSIENEEWKPVSDFAQEQDKAIEAAKNTLNREKQIELRISQKDYDQIQLRAIEEGLSYQSLISSIVHKYLTGSLNKKTL